MKKFYLILACTAILILAGCENKPKEVKDGILNDSAETVEQESPVAGPTQYYLTQDSIGPVKVGMKIADIPAAVPNLYDDIVVNNIPGARAITFSLGDDAQFTVYDMEQSGTVDIIELVSNGQGINTPNGEIRIGDDFEKVLALGGVTTEWEQTDDGGIWYWKWNGLFIGVDEATTSEKFNDMLCNGRHAPGPTQFNNKIKVGSISTGLPF